MSDRLVCYVTASCPFCTRLKWLFDSLGVQPLYVDINNFSSEMERQEFHDAVERTKHDTVPLVLFQGELLGGCDDLCALADSGELARRLDLPTVHCSNLTHRLQRRDGHLPWLPLVRFPTLANRWVTQLVGVQVAVMCALIIAFREERWAWWVTLGMALDFFARFCFGGSASMLGSIGVFVVSFFPGDEELVPGAPKQFAALVGTFFCLLATILFHAGDGSSVSTIGAPVVLGGLLGASFFQGFFNTCIGCIVFGYLIRFGIVSEGIYQPYTDSQRFVNYSSREYHKRVGFVSSGVVNFSVMASLKTAMGWRRRPTPTEDTSLAVGVSVVPTTTANHSEADRTTNEEERVPMAVHVLPEVTNGVVLPTDFPYKYPKTDDTTRESWGLRYIEFGHFSMVLGLAGFALVLKGCAQLTPGTFTFPFEAWHVSAIFAAVWYGLFVFAMLWKLIVAPHKLYMEVQHPLKRHGVVMLPICNLIFSALLEGYSNEFQSVLWWAGVVPIGVLLVIQVALFTRHRHIVDHIVPSLLMGPAACLVVAVVTPAMASINPGTAGGYQEVAQWFGGCGLLFFLMLLTSTWFNAASHQWADERLRPLSAMWGGSCFIACLAWITVQRLASFDTVAFACFASGVLFYVAALYNVDWLLPGRFDMMNWNVAFPLDVAALAALQYFRTEKHAFSQAVAWVFLVSAGFSNFTCFFHTLALIVKRKFPAPAPKFGPMSFNKLQHEALRELFQVIQRECQPTTKASDHSEARLVELLNMYVTLQNAHAEVEDELLFPMAREIYPMHAQHAEEHHEVIHEQLHEIHAMLDQGDIAAVRRLLLVHLDFVLDHMQFEEDHVQTLFRKHFPLALQKRFVERVWDLLEPKGLHHRTNDVKHITDSRLDASRMDWEESVVLCIRYLPEHGQRLRFLKALTWGVPDRAQMLGLWLNRGLATKDPVGEIKLAMIFNDMPELIPRGGGVSYARAL